MRIPFLKLIIEALNVIRTMILSHWLAFFIKVDFLKAGSTFVAEIDRERNSKTPPQQRDFHYFHEAQNL